MEASGRFATLPTPPSTIDPPARVGPCPPALQPSLCVVPAEPRAGRPGLTRLPVLPPQLYAELRTENERLREALTETTLRLAQLKVELERATQVSCCAPGVVRGGPDVPAQARGQRGGWVPVLVAWTVTYTLCSLVTRDRSALQRGPRF